MPTRTVPQPTWPLGIAVTLVGWLFLVVTGVPIGEAFLLGLVVTTQSVAGGYLWSLVRRGLSGAVEAVGMGLALGTVLATLSGLLVQVLTGWSFGWALPALVATLLWIGRRDWRVRPSAATWDTATAWGLAATGVIGLASLGPNLRSYPLAWTGTWSGYHADFLYFESLATSLARLGPLDSIYTPDALIRYHWLVYAWTGQIADALDAGPFVVLTRVLPFVAVVGSCLIAVAWARRMSTAVWAPALAVVLLVAGGYLGATYGAIFNFDSPSQSLTTLWLLAMALLVVVYLGSDEQRDPRRAIGILVLLASLTFALAGGKISAGAVGLAAVLWVAFIGTVRRAGWRRRSVAAGGTALVAFALGYLLIVAGSADPGGLKLANLIDRASSIQGLNPVSGSLGILLGTLILAVAIAVRWSGLAWFLIDRDRRWQPDSVLGVGFVLAAVTTVLLISGGMNDTWFALAASAPLAVISAAGAGEAWLSLGDRRGRALVWSLLAALVLFGAVIVLWMTGASGGNVFVSTWRWAGPLVGAIGAVAIGVFIGRRFGGGGARSGVAGAVLLLALVAAPGRVLGVGTDQVGTQPGLSEDAFSPIESFTEAVDRTGIAEWSDQHVAGAAWLREHADRGALVATNVTYSPFVPALTGLRTLASGILYQAPYGRPSGLETLLRREQESWAFIDSPTEATIDPLCSAGVSWVWVDPTRTTTDSWLPFADIAYRNASVTALRILPGSCD